MLRFSGEGAAGELCSKFCGMVSLNVELNCMVAGAGGSAEMLHVTALGEECTKYTPQDKVELQCCKQGGLGCGCCSRCYGSY